MTDEIEQDNKPLFYIRETVNEKVVDTHTELDENEDGEPITRIVSEDQTVSTVRTYGPFVEEIADQESDQIKNRFSSLALAGDLRVEKVSAEDFDHEAEENLQDPSPASQKPVVTDVLLDGGGSTEATADPAPTAPDSDAPVVSPTAPAEGQAANEADATEEAHTDPVIDSNEVTADGQNIEDAQSEKGQG